MLYCNCIGVKKSLCLGEFVMESYDFLCILAVILLATKLLGLLSERVHMPQVVGALAAGILLGPSVFGWVEETDFLLKTSEIGVILLMFLAGLDTDLTELKKTGMASLFIAVIGVVLPLAGGTACYLLFYHDPADAMDLLKALFIGVVLTATSVSITVETLREMGKLKGRVGTAILGAAVIDDILGIVVLTVISGFADPSVCPLQVFGGIGLFFVFAGVVGLVCYRVFRKMDVIWSHHRRIAIAALAFCLVLSYIAERVFGIADITGAYLAGLILCNIMDLREYVAKKINIMNYMFFAPVFFASIGIKTELGGMNTAEALHIACLLNRPLVDADPAGRSVPELIHSTFYLKDRPIHPMAVATWFGDVIILKEVADDFRAEALVRSMACVSGDEVSVCDHPMTGDQYRRSVIPGAISYAWKIGKVLRKAKEDGCDAAQAIAEAAGGAVLFRGRVKNLCSQCRDGFDCGETLLEGTGSYAGETYRIQFKNENLIACRNDKTDVTVPDLICMVDKNGNPMTNPDFSPGDEMNVFALPAPEIWTGEDGLKILGPSYFGIDEPYIPFQQRTR